MDPVDGSDGGDCRPPSAQRVARRAAVLAAVTCRGFLEDHENLRDADALRQRALAWLKQHDLESELEPIEAEMLSTAAGQLGFHERIDSGWLCEGLAVLAWALHRHDLPPHDVAVDAQAVLESVGFLAPGVRAMLDDPTLRTTAELERCKALLRGIHWRCEQFSRDGKAVDFLASATTACGATIPGQNLSLADRDLAIRGRPIASVTPDEFDECSTIAMERHRAINWLLGRCPTYSETPTET
jgi:hypothetical protein